MGNRSKRKERCENETHYAIFYWIRAVLGGMS